MTASNEPLPPLASIDNIKAWLAGVVRTASDARNGAPVMLTFVGGEFVKAAGATFEKHMTALADQGLVAVPKSRRKLAPFVEVYCDDILVTEASAAGSVLVLPRDPHGGAPVAAAAATLRFHRAVLTAFIRPLEGKRRFLNLDQIGFTDVAERPPGERWKEIDAKFVLGADPKAAIDGAALQARIEEWAQGADVPISRLVVKTPPTREVGGHFTQLLEIIDALPPAIADQWSIPAAVLKHLRHQR
jgi:hypothetical protein